MIDYAFYTDTYRGNLLQPEEFSRLIERAGVYLARLERVYTVTAPTENAREMALCAMAEALQSIESGTAGAVSSASIGSVSVTYATGNAEKASEAKTLYRAAGLYLDIYRGCGR